MAVRTGRFVCLEWGARVQPADESTAVGRTRFPPASFEMKGSLTKVW